jgi:hypothetical protein
MVVGDIVGQMIGRSQVYLMGTDTVSVHSVRVFLHLTYLQTGCPDGVSISDGHDVEPEAAFATLRHGLSHRSERQVGHNGQRIGLQYRALVRLEKPDTNVRAKHA